MKVKIWYIDIISVAISEFSEIFIKCMNQEDDGFKSHFIFEKFSFVNKGFTYNITYNSENEGTGIVQMTSDMRDNFERDGNYFSIDVIRSLVCNAK